MAWRWRFRVSGLGFRVSGFGFRVRVSGFGLGFRVSGSILRDGGLEHVPTGQGGVGRGSSVPRLGFEVWGLGFGVEIQGWGLRVPVPGALEMVWEVEGSWGRGVGIWGIGF